MSPKLALYGGLTRGLEESGVAPDNAANRNEALPAIQTEQVDLGVRWTLTSRWRLVAGVFQVEKPYFINNDQNVYTTLGEVRHRGVEISLTGQPVEGLTVIGGVVAMAPRVTGEAVEDGRLGNRPVGTAPVLLRVNTEYRLPSAKAWSIDAGLSYTGERIASRNGRSKAPAYTLIDVGTRYRFTIHGNPATLRAQISNLTDEFVWNITGDNSFGLTDKRRASLTLAVDF